MRRVIGVVIDGKLVNTKPEKRTEHPLNKEYNRAYNREQFAQDVVQPWKNGRPNPEYIQAFGKEEASNYFSKEQIKEAMNG